MKRLSATYFLYFAQLGVLIPYLGIFLDGRGFSSAEIGELIALVTLARILGPTLWAGIADKSGKTLAVMQLGCFLTIASFIGVFWAREFVWLTLFMGLMMMFWTAVLPQLEVITLDYVKRVNKQYGSIRLWGSIGFIVLTVVTGDMLDRFGSETPIVVSAVVLTLLFISSLLITHPAQTHTQSTVSKSDWHAAAKPVFIVFIISALLLQVSFGVYYGFFALYMRDLGYSGQLTGILIAIGVVAEVGIFILSERMIRRFGVKWLLIISMILTAARWWLLGSLADSLLILVLAQGLHAFSFGLTHATSVAFIHHYFTPQFQSRGQALYISLGFGIGGALGNWLAGMMWQQGQGATVSFSVSAIIALLAGLVLIPLSRHKLV